MTAVVVIRGDQEREKAAAWARKAPTFSRITFKGPKRTLPQNDRLWAMLTEVSEQTLWHGQRLKPGDWKDLFTAALKRELRLVPNLTGDGFVMLGAHTSEMEVPELGELIELIFAWGAEHNVTFREREAA